MTARAASSPTRPNPVAGRLRNLRREDEHRSRPLEAHYVELLRWFNVAWMHEIDSPEELARILRSRAPTRLADLPPKIRHRIGKEYQSAMADIALSHRKRVTLDRRIRALEHAEKVLGQLPYREQRRLEAMRRERAASKGAT